MTLSWIPKPPERAARIASEAAQRVQVDEESLRPAVRELMRTRPDDFIWIAAEESALSLLRDSWTDELSDEIVRALGAVHEQRLAEAESVLEALDDLEEHGRDSWAAKAVLANFAFNIAYDIVDEDGV
jgi:hypothetical protein